ncbi:MAG: hypothetical protein A3B28_03645 [Candidatus Wildermuthbacteria bacterium RIFCSPLOWO2_01_FULL_50_46]|uniref:Uncharacterized protein n=1 Tax=Candidatus Yanofskybacteria bacterium GW2011_GWC1_48_11 TaxID=1619027 RepID=A0A837ISH3_9BACT|nr:MAG: hypothetical protein UY25_C0003G0075 [Candidatus Yanofskybacteria bacterium GW2011_GWC1_48_11]KKW13124.1 MAG: hypothetical protein UY53_C0018G0008 [Parcubacteria group bacterium GW2011_GWA2_50_10]OHA74579.1 MAG: hypothetical protein A3B28_03645 [Candidatus Wildermuthbacteria bacterium RIFCSPLOWO2_01_FULL_50_46]OHA77816.1 MAG: hypothetical protein A2564_01290 [Candidatus Wildermuthbacteria bacterium RIFOXYD1_FULL_50_12]
MTEESINKASKSFHKAFAVVFISKLAVRYGFLPSALEGDNAMLIGLLLLLQGILVISMMFLLGYYAYKFSGKWYYALNGLLGLFWFAMLGPLIGGIIVYQIKEKNIKKLERNKNGYGKNVEKSHGTN